MQHVNVNNAQDFWFTSTMVGAATLVLGTVTLDSHGKVTSFTADPTKPTFAGQLQQWFGASFNKNNFSNSALPICMPRAVMGPASRSTSTFT